MNNALTHFIPSFTLNPFMIGSKRPPPPSNQRSLSFGPSQASGSAAVPSIRGFGASQPPSTSQATLEAQTGFSSARLFGSSQMGKAAPALQAAVQPPRKLPFVKS
jgi:hypothetical protein